MFGLDADAPLSGGDGHHGSAPVLGGVHDLGYPPDNEHPIPQVWWSGAWHDQIRITYLDRDYTCDEFVLEYATKEAHPSD